jgi:hypothetical protein
MWAGRYRRTKESGTEIDSSISTIDTVSVVTGVLYAILH